MKAGSRGAIGAAVASALVFGGSAQAAPGEAVEQTQQAGGQTLAVPAPEAPKAGFRKAAEPEQPGNGQGKGGEGGGGNGGEPEPEPRSANLFVKVHGLKGGKVRVGSRIKALGRIRPFVPGEKVTIRLKRNGKTLKVGTSRVRPAKGNMGRYTLKSPKIIKPGRYSFLVRKKRSDAQQGGVGRSRSARVKYPDLDPGQRNKTVRLFRKLIEKQGYYAKGGSRYEDHLERAVLAFRKVNRMPMNTNATPKIFKKLAKGKGGFKLKHPGAGKHTEVDLSRQVMVLASKGKVRHTFHISSGAAATPSDLGTYRYYRKEPGLNSIGMYYSVYYNRGEATHGYKSVPNYPASHGCIRNPIPDSKFIYNWIDLGDKMIVYR